jgi:hypothetical protein
MLLEDLQRGLPPSLLGANVEAVHAAYQRPCPSPLDRPVRLAILSSVRSVEFLPVNTSSEPAPLGLVVAGAALVSKGYDPSGKALDTTRLVIPARSRAVSTV